jgi:hypothetical protein
MHDLKHKNYVIFDLILNLIYKLLSVYCFFKNE